MERDETPGTPGRRTEALLRLRSTPNLSLRLAYRLLSVVRGPEALFALSARDLAGLGAPIETARELISSRSLDWAHAEWERARAMGVRIVDAAGEGYPPLLREIADPPLLLYVRGREWAPARPHVAIVGARRATRYGIQAAETLARGLAERGIVVVSGLARGIDAAVHRSAIEGGHTVAVLGAGMDRIYPPEHRKLAEQLELKGALVTEFSFGAPPMAWNFPLRNRILAGMSLGAVVVEAAGRSGSLITARLALDANREVFAVPGPIHSPGSEGPHRLIREGAVLVTGWHDILEELRIPAVESSPGQGGSRLGPDAPLKEGARRVLEAIPVGQEVDIDTLVDRVDLPRAAIYSILLDLEFSGRVQTTPPDRFTRIGLDDSNAGGGNLS